MKAPDVSPSPRGTNGEGAGGRRPRRAAPLHEINDTRGFGRTVREGRLREFPAALSNPCRSGRALPPGTIVRPSLPRVLPVARLAFGHPFHGLLKPLLPGGVRFGFGDPL